MEQVGALEASLAERDGELTEMKGSLTEGLPQAQLASTADLKRQLAVERHRTSDQSQLVNPTDHRSRPSFTAD